MVPATMPATAPAMRGLVVPKTGVLIRRSLGGLLWTRDGKWLLGTPTIHRDGTPRPVKLRVSTTTGRVEPFPQPKGAPVRMGSPLWRVGDEIWFAAYAGSAGWEVRSIPNAGGVAPRTLATFNTPRARFWGARPAGKDIEVLLSRSRLDPKDRRINLHHMTIRLASTGAERPVTLPQRTIPMAVSSDWTHVALHAVLSQKDLAVRVVAGPQIRPVPVDVYDTSGKTVATINFQIDVKHSLPQLQISPDNQCVLARNLPGQPPKGQSRYTQSLALIDLADPTVIKILHKGADEYSESVFSPDGRYVAVNISVHRRAGGKVVDDSPGGIHIFKVR